jgi:hypothetical protein
VPASPYWWYDFTVDGRRFRGSTRTEDRELAELFAIKARTQVLVAGEIWADVREARAGKLEELGTEIGLLVKRLIGNRDFALVLVEEKDQRTVTSLAPEVARRVLLRACKRMLHLPREKDRQGQSPA